MVDPKDEQILKELVIHINKEGGYNLAHLKSLSSLHQYKNLYNIFTKYVAQGGQILDWGADSGHFSYFLSKKGYKSTGYSLEKINYTSWMRKSFYKLVWGDPKSPVRLPFKNNQFDGVVSVGVLEHVRETGGDEVKSLKEINRILKKGGYFICYHLPNKFSWIDFVSSKLTKKYHHLYRFTQKDIAELIRASNLQLVEVGQYGILPRNSLSRLPLLFRYSIFFTALYDFMDNFLEKLFPQICQNYYFVAIKQ